MFLWRTQNYHQILRWTSPAFLSSRGFCLDLSVWPMVSFCFITRTDMVFLSISLSLQFLLSLWPNSRGLKCCYLYNLNWKRLLMHSAKFQPNPFSNPWEIVLTTFTIYSHGDHLGWCIHQKLPYVGIGDLIILGLKVSEKVFENADRWTHAMDEKWSL